VLVTQKTPGGLYERSFEELGRPVDGESGPLTEATQLDSETSAAIGVEYGIEMPPPIAQRSRA
jgi:hypothetical protein